MWEEGPSGELLIAQKLLVPRKSHMVSNRREGSGKHERMFHVLTVIPSPSSVRSPDTITGCLRTAHTFLKLPMVSFLGFLQLLYLL